jgi:FtsH-binding integral membrane protein
MKRLLTFAPHAIAIFAALVFLDSLRFKFTNAEETKVIFGLLDGWAASFGAQGLFAQTGLFSQYVIGSAELVASTLLLAGIVPRLRRLQALGALVALAVMSGAVSFHLFTPLGIDPNNDGGGLFAAAVVIWLTSVVMLFIRRKELTDLATGLRTALIG